MRRFRRGFFRRKIRVKRRSFRSRRLKRRAFREIGGVMVS